MDFFGFFTTVYNQFLAVFPPQLQWLITLLVVIGFVGVFIALIKHSWIFIIILIILLPVAAPILRHFVTDVYNLYLFLSSQK